MPAPRYPYYIIETGHSHYTVLDMVRDPGFAELVQLEKAGKLKSEHPTVVPRSST